MHHHRSKTLEMSLVPDPPFRPRFWTMGSTATDAKSFRFRPVIISDCVGDRSAVAHVFTLADIQARFSDVISLAETLQQLQA
ncbi:MAG: hypothetical protein VB862_15015 [Pirellulaceae bacterium]